MLLATRQGAGASFAATRKNPPVKVHERADDGVTKVPACEVLPLACDGRDLSLFQVMSVYTRCRRTRYEMLDM